MKTSHPNPLEYGGQFQAQRQASHQLLVLGPLAVLGVFLVLCQEHGSWRSVLQVLVNTPPAALGSIAVLLITH